MDLEKSMSTYKLSSKSSPLSPTSAMSLPPSGSVPSSSSRLIVALIFFFFFFFPKLSRSSVSSKSISSPLLGSWFSLSPFEFSWETGESTSFPSAKAASMSKIFLGFFFFFIEASNTASSSDMIVI
uniref:Uncharacterized protein n=1 Tax=Cacopsylla melanoneura TaxID=428564 RepID=A0A8D8XBS2_9HEMI